MSSTTEFKTSSEDELSLLDVLNKTPQLDAVILRQIFLLMTRNFYSNPRAFNADGTNIPNNYYNYTYSDNIVDPEHKQKSTISIDLVYSSYDNSIDKTDYLALNQKYEDEKNSIMLSIGIAVLSAILSLLFRFI